MFLTIVLIMSMTSSCNEKKDGSLRNDARDLYIESLKITNIYIDSIFNSKDSTTLLSLCSRYDEALTKLNYKYAAGADYKISEGENDTLITMSDRLIFLRDSLLDAFAHPLIIRTDSIIGKMNDSILHQ